MNVLRRWWAALLRRWRRRRRADVERETGEVASGRELDALATALEVSRLTDEQFVQVLDTVRMLDESGAGVSVSGMSTQSLVDLIARASREQLRALADHAELREFLLSELFDRMAQHLVVDKTRHVDAVIDWTLTSGDGEPSRYQTHIVEGSCETAQDLGLSPDVSITTTVDDFLRMATSGNSRALSLLVTGRVKVRGDYAVAARFLGYFDIPKPGVSPR